MRDKLCRECGKSAAFSICAQCSVRYDAVTPRVSVGTQAQYGYRLTKGFILMHYEDDEYVSARERDYILERPGPVLIANQEGRVTSMAKGSWPSRWWRDD